MTRKNKKYQLLISTLLLCFLQMAGIDVYAQAPVTPVQKDTTITHREPPKARARRHRDPMQEQDSLRKDSIVLPPKHLQSIDSLSAAKIQVADSLDAANKKWTEEDRTAGSHCREYRYGSASIPKTLIKRYSYLIRPKLPGLPSYSRVEDRFTTANTGNCLLYMEDLPVVRMPWVGMARCIKTIRKPIWTLWTAIQTLKSYEDLLTP